MDELIRAVAENMPRFEDWTLRGFVEKQINSAPSFIDTVYREAVKLVNGAVSYDGYDILSPVDRVLFELKKPQYKKPQLSVAVSELELLRFKFSHDGEHYETHFYTPYVHNDMLVIGGKRYGLIKNVTDQIFSRTKNRGVQVRPIRALLDFNRNHQFRLVSMSRGVLGSEFVITTRLWHKEKKGKRVCKFTVLHYLLCKFGFTKTMLQFGLMPDDFAFVDHPGLFDDHEHDYFAAKLQSKKGLTDVYLKVKRHLLDGKDNTIRKVAANLLYLLTHFSFHTVETLYDPGGHDFRVMLGCIINDSSNNVEAKEAKARSDADNHIASVDLFIDPLTRNRFHTFGLHVDDIYGLLRYIFVEIDRYLVNTVPQNLYKKRLDVIDGTLVLAYATTIFVRFYACHGKPSLQKKEVKQLFYPKAMAIQNIYSQSRRKRNSLRNVNPSPEIYGDNWLVSSGIVKLRPGGAPQDRFDPSMAVVESIIAFSGSKPGLTGWLNPYLKICPEGGVILPDYADDISPIKEFLSPSR